MCTSWVPCIPAAWHLLPGSESLSAWPHYCSTSLRPASWVVLWMKQDDACRSLTSEHSVSATFHTTSTLGMCNEVLKGRNVVICLCSLNIPNFILVIFLYKPCSKSSSVHFSLNFISVSSITDCSYIGFHRILVSLEMFMGTKQKKKKVGGKGSRVK